MSNEKMNNRVFGICGIKVIGAMFNAGMEGTAKTFDDGTYIASDVCNKFLIRAKENNIEGKNILVFRKNKVEKGKIQPSTLEEKYTEMFGEPKEDKAIEVLDNLLKCSDVRQFGCTFAVNKVNIGIHGPVQLTYSENKYEDTYPLDDNILSPFKNSNAKSEDKTMTTTGTKHLLDKAHYFFSFSVFPEQLDKYIPLLDNFKGYTVDDYNDLKENLLTAVTEYNSASKAGCENDFALFVEFKDNVKLAVPNLKNYIKFKVEDDMDVIDLGDIFDILTSKRFKGEIKNIEVYYNTYKTKLIGVIKAANTKLYDITTRNEVKE